MCNFDTILIEIPNKEDGTVYGNSAILLNKKYVLTTANGILQIFNEQNRKVLFSKLQPGQLYTKLFENIVSPPINAVWKNGTSEHYIVKKAEILTMFCSKEISTSNNYILKDWAIDAMGNKSDLNKILSLFFVLTIDTSGSISEFNTLLKEWWHQIMGISISKGDELQIVSVPFGNRNFLETYSKGIVSNTMGNTSCFLLSDCPTAPGSEGSAVYIINNKVPVGIVLSSLSWWKGEWLGLTLIANIKSILFELVATKKNIYIDNNLSLETKYNLLNAVELSLVQIYYGSTWGTGILINKEQGIFITNSHVVECPFDTDVKIFWNEHVFPAQVLYKTPNDNVFDLAVLKCRNIDALQKLPLKSINICNGQPNAGDAVFAAGFALFQKENKLQPTLTKGCVSNWNPYMIRTTCSIHPGASGGAILNPNGDLLGVIVSNTKLSLGDVQIYPRINMGIPVVVFINIINDYLIKQDSKLLDLLNTNVKEAITIWKRMEGKL